MMGEFLFYQGDFKQSYEDVLTAENHILSHKTIAKSEEIKEQLE
jgi:hypothetical protein